LIHHSIILPVDVVSFVFPFGYVCKPWWNLLPGLGKKSLEAGSRFTSAGGEIIEASKKWLRMERMDVGWDVFSYCVPNL